MIEDIEELEELRQFNTQEVLRPLRAECFTFTLADGTVETLGGGRRLEPSTFVRDRPERGEKPKVLRGESDELSSPNPRQDDSTREGAEAENDFWSIRGEIPYTAITLNPEANCTYRKKNFFLFH